MDYKFGIIKRMNLWGARRAIGVCNCGQHLIGTSGWYSEFSCDNCHNEFFIDATSQSNKRFTIPYLESVRKDNRGFKVKRTNLSVTYDGTQVIPIKENLTRTLEYDIVDKVFKVWREDELEYEYIEGKGFNSHHLLDVQKKFLTQLEERVFLEFISNDVTRAMFTKVVKSLGRNYNKKDDVFLGLIKLMTEHSYLQILANAGITSVDRFHEQHRRHRQNTIINNEETKPHKILGIPKYFIPYIREDISFNLNILSSMQEHLGFVDANKMREIMGIVKDEGRLSDLAGAFSDIIQIHIDYEYTNLRKLILYLFREVRLTQGLTSPISASNYLRDYIRMSKALKLDYEKYPKSLKKVHDVVQMNYKVINQGNEKDDFFKQAVDTKTYKRLNYTNDKSDFSIITPKEPKDLIKEGNQLSHCVSSYIDDVISNRCKILFLRDKEDIDKPLATIEVRGFNIRQAKGFANRDMTEEQKEFISVWAEENNLVENYY